MQFQKAPSSSRRAPSPATEEQQTPIEYRSSSFQHYNYPRVQNRKDPQRELTYLMISLLIQLLALTVILFLSALAVNYLVISTQEFGQIPNCLWSQISFGDWFSLRCLQCQQGYSLTSTSANCHPI